MNNYLDIHPALSGGNFTAAGASDYGAVLSDLFLSAVAPPASKNTSRHTVAWAHFNDPIDYAPGA